MKVIRHQNELVQKVRIPVRQKILKEQRCPGLRTEKRARFPRLCRNEVRLRVVGCMLSRRYQNIPQGLKPCLSLCHLRYD